MIPDSQPKRVWVRTLGCQMNKLDGQLLLSQLAPLGYEPTDRRDEADLLIFHTCSVRQHAEDRAYSLIGETRKLVRRRPEVVVAVVGCMAQREGERLHQRAPHIRMVVGTRMLGQFAQLLTEVERTVGAVVATDEGSLLWPNRLVRFRRSRFQAFVSIMRGCDNFCSYCIVPYVRGRAVSRPTREIVAEVQSLAADGVVEVTLLGQNVDAYGRDRPSEGWSLADLLRRLHEVPRLRRRRVVTSHPRAMPEELLQPMAARPRVAPYLPRPAQSGSDAVLRRMRRGYTRAHYLHLVERARQLIPDVTVASDFIVGFPGETDEDFQQTADLLREAGFKNSFIFKYSPRPGPGAAGLPDDVPLSANRQRNQELRAVQAEVSRELNRECIGRTLSGLVEGPSKRDPCRLTGRSGGDHIVCFRGSDDLVGREVEVLITEVTALTLFGELVEDSGEDTVAATEPTQGERTAR